MKVAIVGGGISGLSLAYFLQDFAEVDVFEKEKWGGKAYTQKIDGYLMEEGVNGFLSNSELTIKLAKEVGADLVKADETSKVRYIYDTSLQKLPSNPIEFLTSDILSFKGKFRVLKEFFIKPECVEESVEEFAIRRLGKEFANKFMVPMVAGIFASAPHRISVNAAFSRIKEIECKYGSLFKGMLKLKRGGAPKGELYSFNKGISEFISKLKSNTKANFFIQNITSLEELRDYDKIVLAIPTYEAAKLVNKELSTYLNKIEYNPVAVVGLDYADFDMKSFGVLTLKEKSLGILFDKAIFPNRNGIRVMVGGSRCRDVVNLSDKEIIELAKSDVEKILGLSNPKFEWIKVHKKAIPEYRRGHKSLVEYIFNLAKQEGIYLHGNAYKGVSMNDCIKNSFDLAKEIVNGR